jgi:hypothetical protein
MEWSLGSGRRPDIPVVVKFEYSGVKVSEIELIQRMDEDLGSHPYVLEDQYICGASKR